VGSYPNPFQFATVSGDVDIHTAQNYYQLLITVSNNYGGILNERSFEYPDPFIYDSNLF